jgi:hypothetical protein
MYCCAITGRLFEAPDINQDIDVSLEIANWLPVLDDVRTLEVPFRIAA